jgi:hypothetical protein
MIHFDARGTVQVRDRATHCDRRVQPALTITSNILISSAGA